MSVSINFLIPVYNAERYLKRCLDSIYTQITDSPHEVILVNDGSTDSSGTICDNYKTLYPNQTVVYHKQNEGVAKTRNFLLEHASKDFIWFVDSDDTIKADAVAEIMKTIEEHQQLDLLTLSYKHFTKVGYGELRNIPSQPGKMLTGIQYLDLEQPQFYLWCNVYNLKFITAHSIYFNTSLSVLEDSLFNIEAFITAKTTLPTNIYAYNYYVDNPSSAMSNPAFRLRNAEHTFTAIDHVKRLQSQYNGYKETQILNNYLAHLVIGFVYSLYLGNFDIKLVRDFITRLKILGLYPMRRCKNKRANAFLLLGNRYYLFCLTCWLKNKLHSNTVIKS